MQCLCPSDIRLMIYLGCIDYSIKFQKDLIRWQMFLSRYSFLLSYWTQVYFKNARWQQWWLLFSFVLTIHGLVLFECCLCSMSLMKVWCWYNKLKMQQVTGSVFLVWDTTWIAIHFDSHDLKILLYHGCSNLEQNTLQPKQPSRMILFIEKKKKDSWILL